MRGLWRRTIPQQTQLLPPGIHLYGPGYRDGPQSPSRLYVESIYDCNPFPSIARIRQLPLSIHSYLALNDPATHNSATSLRDGLYL